MCGPPDMMQHISGDKAKDYSQGEVVKHYVNQFDMSLLVRNAIFKALSYVVSFQLTGLLKELGYTESMVYKFWRRVYLVLLHFTWRYSKNIMRFKHDMQILKEGVLGVAEIQDILE